MLKGMELELLKLFANAGVPALLLFYLVWQHVAFSKQLLEAITRLTEKIDSLAQEFHRAQEEATNKLLRAQSDLEKVLLQLIAKR